MPSAMTPRLAAHGISRFYHDGQSKICGLATLDIALYPGEFLVVIGPSGVGKSTLLHLLSGLDRPDTGTIRYQDEQLEQLNPKALAQLRNRDFGFVFQRPHVLMDRNIIENIALPLRYAPHTLRRQGYRRAQALLETVGLGGYAKRRPNTLSGGELQRVVFARALVCLPQILFADEPTANLDRANAVHLLELLAAQAKQGRSIVLATHDEHAMRYGDRRVSLVCEPASDPATSSGG